MPASPPSMVVQVVVGSGRGPTELAAFDAALCEAGIENTNLIRLSSVLPPAAEVLIHDRADHGALWGDRLYVVYADQRTSVFDEEVWAGVGWIQFEDGRGLFVEHEGDNEILVRSQIHTSLDALCETRGLQSPEHQVLVHGTRCGGEPVCAVVAAVFESEPWNGRV